MNQKKRKEENKKYPHYKADITKASTKFNTAEFQEVIVTIRSTSKAFTIRSLYAWQNYKKHVKVLLLSATF
jgi:hypothetical protein